MGYDFQNQHVFVGDRDAKIVRSEITEYISTTLATDPCPLSEAERSIVVGPPGRWIFVGDSAGGTENGDAESFDSLSIDLSRIAPTLAIKMSDSAIVHFYLYSNEVIIDKFGNGTFPFYLFRNSAEARPFVGDCKKWAEYMLKPNQLDILRRTWSQDGDATEVLTNTALLFGLHPKLCTTGYTTFDEAEEIKYYDWLPSGAHGKDVFDEFHFLVD